MRIIGVAAFLGDLHCRKIGIDQELLGKLHAARQNIFGAGYPVSLLVKSLEMHRRQTELFCNDRDRPIGFR